MVAVQVQLLDPSTPAGPRVTIDIQSDTPVIEMKRQLHLKTGVPIEHIKVMLSGINQIVMGDKRQLRFTYCGSANNVYFAVTAAEGKQPTTGDMKN